MLQSIKHFKLHHRQNNIIAIVMVVSSLLVAMYYGIRPTQDGDKPCSECSVSNKQIANLAWFFALVSLIVWVLNYRAIENSRRCVIDYTIDKTNEKELLNKSN